MFQMSARSSKTMGKGKNQTKSKESVEDRFSAAETRPQFRPLKQKKSKVVLDERFSSVLTDSRFQLQEKDKYGRRKKKQDAKEELSSFYAVEEEDPTKKAKDHAGKDEEASKDHLASESSAEGREDSSESEGENEDPASRIAYLTAFSRGELEITSSSDEDDSSQSSDDEDEGDGEDPVYGTAGILDPSKKEEEIEISHDQSPYLVVTNMDWEHVRATDLFCILSSFTPPGALKRVQVFQSDFGIERMAKDKVHGPSNIWKSRKEKTLDVREDDADEEDSMSDESDGDEVSEGSVEMNDSVGIEVETNGILDESDFDPEKLRAYEASKLKYFFAVVEFRNPDHADIAYREVDGMEFEHSSAAIDLRTLPPEEVNNVVKDRPMRDEAISVPSNYEPPDFVVSALQQTNVQCTWDQGDVERERKLTNYGAGGWQAMMETDDLKVYLASDASSDEESEDEKETKGSKVRKLLGLDSDDGDEQNGPKEVESSGEDERSSDDEGMSKEIKFIPGQKNLEEKIRTKLQAKDEPEELTPWQKYQEKRKLKRKERRQASRNRRRGLIDDSLKQESNEDAAESENDDYFVEDESAERRKLKIMNGKQDERSKDKKSKDELELLLAGDNDEEQTKDYDIRGIQRIEKNKGKKLRGSRKRKEDKLAADVSGADFKINVEDNRFAAVLDGSDDRFGIDKTDPNYKDTSGMREILSEQTKRRKKKRKRKQTDSIVPDVSAESEGKTTGSSALSSLVLRLKSKVSKNSQ